MNSAGQFERALLYVGPPKTGSSSIEGFVFRNRDALMAQGVYVPVAGMVNKQHIEIAAVLARGASKPRRKRLNFQADIAPGEARGRRAKFLSALADELALAPSCHTLFFMSEAIFASGPDEVRAYREVCAPYAPHLESLMYLRRQDRWLASLTLQNRKVGRRNGLALTLGMPWRYENNIRTWHSESDRCHIRRFDPEFLVRGSLIDDFCDTIGVDVAGLDMEDVRANPAPLQEQLELVDALNLKLASMSFADQKHYRTRFLDLTAKTLSGTKIEFPRSELASVFQSFAGINEWLRETIDPSGPPLFFNADFGDYPLAPLNDRQYTVEQLNQLRSVILPAAEPVTDRTALIDSLISDYLAATEPPNSGGL